MSKSTRFPALFRWLPVLATLLCVVMQARADSGGNVLMPGQVIQKHAKFESECGDCHKRFDKTAQPELCKSCHKAIAKDEITRHGLHGHHVKKNICKECHHEHKGREVPLFQLDTKEFDHAKQTGFELKGGHLSEKVLCKNCHIPGKKYRDVLKTCNGCHARKDKHKGALGKACQSCHEEKNWKTLHFDHGRTRFNVLGKHSGVKCSACHAGNTFKRTPRECNVCHRKDDKHKGKFGAKCATCHTDRGWKEILFDHGKATRYPLLGKHLDAKCESCHKGNLYKSRPKLKTDCYSCHKKEDKHKGQEGKKCESCHTPHAWKKAEFDHRLSSFALTGMHTQVACNKCHITVVFKDAKSDCGSCHEKQDVHKRRLGTGCETCHNTRNWRDWDFDHDKTRFKLQNGHAGLKCIDCHVTPVEKKIGPINGCGTCHEKDDKHDGAYGEKCDRCHTDVTWRNIKVGSTKFINQDASKGPTDATAPTKQKSAKHKRSKKKKKKTQH